LTPVRLTNPVWSPTRAGAVEFSLFTTSVLVLQGARFLFNIAVARTIPGEQFTYWALLLAALTYAPAVFAGSLNGLGRQLPYLRGAGRLAEAEAAEASVNWTLVAIVVVIVLVAVSLSTAGALGQAWPLALIVAGTLVFSLQQFVLRSSLAFNRASIQQLVLGVSVLATAGLLILIRHLEFNMATLAYGVCLLIAAFVGVALHMPALRHPSRYAWWQMAAIGFPIMLAGIVFSVFVTSDRWIATTLLGASSAAPYALASVVGSSMLIIPTVISQQTYPRMAILYGQTHDRHQVLGMARRQSLIAGAAAVPLAIIADVVVILVVPVLLPAYRDAVAPACVIALGFAVIAGSTGFGNYLNVVGEQWTYLRVQIGSTIVAVALMVAGARLAGALGIAVGVSLGYVLYAIWLRASTRGGAKPERSGS
jgi:O-antigen/teichoic acid export membrane protein